MGMEFVRKAAKSFHKGLDKSRARLGAPGLFTQEPTSSPRAYAADLRSGQSVQAGEKVGVRMDGPNVVALRGLDRVATFKNPAGLKEALAQSHGEACGTVRAVHGMAGVVEITIC